MGTFSAPNGGKEAQAAVNFLEWQFRDDAKSKEFCSSGMTKVGWKVMQKNFK